MSDGYSNRRFQCPFFQWDERRKVHCEGGLVVLPPPELKTYMDRYCAAMPGWQDCPIAKGLEASYERS